MDPVLWLTHSFHVCIYAGVWRDVPGVYIFTGINSQNQWVALYVGQADSFRSRLANHERWDEAVRLGATHVHALEVPQASQRDAIEQALIRAYHPPLNTHHRA